MKSTTPSRLEPRESHHSAAEGDLRERDLAARDDRALVRYEAKWQRRLRQLQQVFPERWRVRGLSDEEVRDLLTLRLIEAVRRGSPEELAQARPGKEWGFLIVQHELRRLRKSFKLAAICGDFGDAPAWGPTPTQEDAWLEGEAERGRTLAQERAEQSLTRPQRRWLAAMKLSARAGGFFESSAEPNLSAAARMLGKHRSSAQRAFRELSLRFTEELERVE